MSISVEESLCFHCESKTWVRPLTEGFCRSDKGGTVTAWTGRALLTLGHEESPWAPGSSRPMAVTGHVLTDMLIPLTY